MGLEAGWNCHISLLSDELSLNEGPGSGPGSFTQGRQSAESASQDHIDLQGNTERKMSEEVMASRSQSAPCVIAVDDVQQVKFKVQSPEEIPDDSSDKAKDKPQPRVRIPSDKSTGSTAKSKSTSHSRSDRSEQEEEMEEEEEDEEDARETNRLLSSSASSMSSSSSSSEGELDHQSDSRYTSSYVTEYTDDSLTGALDNRVSVDSGDGVCILHLKTQGHQVYVLVQIFALFF